MKSKGQIYLSIVILVSSLFLIVTGSPILSKPFIKDSSFPTGTIVSWIGIIALTLTIYLVFNKIYSSNHKIFRIVFKSIIALASIWGLIGFLLADNWAFVFQNHDKFRGSIVASRYFWIFTASLVVFPILLILILSLLALARKPAKKSETNV